MSDPRRLVEEGDLGAALLSAAVALDADEARARKAALLGVAASGAAVTAAAIVAQVVPKSLGTVLLIKSILVGLLVAIVSGAVVAALSASSARPVDTASPLVAASPPVLPAAILSAPPERVEAPSMPVSPPSETTTLHPPAASPPAIQAVARRHGEAPAASAPSQGHLADEVALLQQARSELRAGQPAGALATLDAHQRQFPQSMLGIEAEVLRIEALSQSGNRNVATARARRFIALHPNTPYGPRLLLLIGESAPREETPNP